MFICIYKRICILSPLQQTTMSLIHVSQIRSQICAVEPHMMCAINKKFTIDASGMHSFITMTRIEQTNWFKNATTDAKVLMPPVDLNVFICDDDTTHHDPVGSPSITHQTIRRHEGSKTVIIDISHSTPSDFITCTRADIRHVFLVDMCRQQNVSSTTIDAIGALLSKYVEYHNNVYIRGVTCELRNVHNRHIVTRALACGIVTHLHYNNILTMDSDLVMISECIRESKTAIGSIKSLKVSCELQPNVPIVTSKTVSQYATRVVQMINTVCLMCIEFNIQVITFRNINFRIQDVVETFVSHIKNMKADLIIERPYHMALKQHACLLDEAQHDKCTVYVWNPQWTTSVIGRTQKHMANMNSIPNAVRIDDDDRYTNPLNIPSRIRIFKMLTSDQSDASSATA